ncbi:hypothetical protein D6783_05350 [Candidatus Woesearchaeota archaeon]|nr:MAG: hypothetical protein D6783_05350 [Candidatus Woesearchaeota archaeon]
MQSSSNNPAQPDNRIVIGLTERVIIKGRDEEVEATAKVDTGATKSSLDVHLAAKLKLGPIIETRLVKNANGNKVRPIIEACIIIRGRELCAQFTLADRSHLKYPVLLGQNILKNGFLIDPAKEA